MDDLPLEVNSFIGRRKELSVVREMLVEARLVTLTGIGGVGKTRLSIQVARQLRRVYADGVLFVSLAEVSSPSLVAMSVMRQAGMRTQDADVIQSLIKYLRNKHLLIVLDNCEHIVEAVARLTAMLIGSGPRVDVLATSREPLRIGGEQVYQVPPLRTPEPDREFSSGEISLFESVSLLIDRARAVSPEFAVTPNNEAAIARLCRDLDGLPLAIELAAVRMRALPPEELTALRHSQYTLLSKGSRSAAPRHQTLRAAIDWSFDLCSETEQRMWASLSVFTGGFDLDGAEVVCADLGLNKVEIMEGVAGLVDKSIVIRYEQPNGVRYGMLETIRQYGRDRLHERGDEAVIRQRHCLYYLGLARRTAAGWFGPDQVELFSRLRVEHPNIRAALEFSLGPDGNRRTGLGLASSLWPLWFATGQQLESKHWIDRLLAADDTPSHERAEALWVSGFFAILTGGFASARHLLSSCRASGLSIGATDLLARVTYAESLLALSGNVGGGGIGPAEAAIRLEKELGDASATAFVVLGMIDLGYAQCLNGQLDIGEALFVECRQICESRGERLLRSFSLLFHGLALVLQGHPREARELLLECVREKREFDDLLGLGLGVEFLAWSETASGDAARAARLFGVCESLWTPLGAYLAGFETLLAWHGQYMQEARRQLDTVVFDEAHSTGSSASRKDALRFVLGEKDQRAQGSLKPAARQVLTKREMEVAALVAEGKSNKDVAETLFLSVRTVNTHVDRILRKLGFNSRSQIARWVTESSQHASAC